MLLQDFKKLFIQSQSNIKYMHILKYMCYISRNTWISPVINSQNKDENQEYCMNPQTTPASLTDISSKSYKQVIEIKIRICCFTRIHHCSQMLWGLNSYLKSKAILLMTAELKPLGIPGNLLNWKLGTAEKPELVPSNKTKCQAHTKTWKSH